MDKTRLFRIIDRLDYEIIRSVIQEKTNTEIAEETGFSIGTVKRRLRCLFKLFGVKTKIGLVKELSKLDMLSTITLTTI